MVVAKLNLLRVNLLNTVFHQNIAISLREVLLRTKFATRKNLGSERRLSCQSKLLGDIVVDVPQESQLHQQLVRKEFEATEITINPYVHLHYIELADNCSTKRTNVLNQIKKALKDQWSLADLNFIVKDWKTILPILKEGEGKCTSCSQE